MGKSKLQTPRKWHPVPGSSQGCPGRPSALWSRGWYPSWEVHSSSSLEHPLDWAGLRYTLWASNSSYSYFWQGGAAPYSVYMCVYGNLSAATAVIPWVGGSVCPPCSNRIEPGCASKWSPAKFKPDQPVSEVAWEPSVGLRHRRRDHGRSWPPGDQRILAKCWRGCGAQGLIRRPSCVCIHVRQQGKVRIQYWMDCMSKPSC